MVVLYRTGNGNGCTTERGLRVSPSWEKHNRSKCCFSVVYGDLDIALGEGLTYEAATTLCSMLKDVVEVGEPVPSEWLEICKDQHREYPNWLQADGEYILTDEDWQELEEERERQSREVSPELANSDLFRWADEVQQALDSLTIRK